MIEELLQYTQVGDLLSVKADGVALGDRTVMENQQTNVIKAKIVKLNGETVNLQFYDGGRGQTVKLRIQFCGHRLQANYAENILSRLFDGSEKPIGHQPELQQHAKITVDELNINRYVLRLIPSSNEI